MGSYRNNGIRNGNSVNDITVQSVFGNAHYRKIFYGNRNCYTLSCSHITFDYDSLAVFSKIIVKVILAVLLAEILTHGFLAFCGIVIGQTAEGMLHCLERLLKRFSPCSCISTRLIFRNAQNRQYC